MELKAGYKLTEVGVIPEDWDVRKLSDVIDSKRSIRYGIVQPGNFETNGCLMLRSQDYSKGWSNSYEMHRVNSFIENQYKNARLSKGDLIMTVVGAGIGQVVIAPDWLDKAIVSRSTARIAVDKLKAANEYILACLSSPIGYTQILNSQKEGAQPVISCIDLGNFIIPYPSVEEQTAIATAISDTDDLIRGLEKLIEKKRAIKQGAMQELLQPKEGWEVKKLGEVSNIVRGASPRPIEDPKWFDENSSIGWVRISDVTKSVKVLTETTQKLSELGIKNSRYVEQDNLIMSICATVGRPILTRINVCIHDGFVVFKNPHVDINYLYYFLNYIEKD